MSQVVKDSIHILGEKIIDFTQKEKQHYLCIGSLCNSLFLYHYFNIKNDQNVLNLCFSEYDKAFSNIENKEFILSHGLIAGSTGIAWLTQYLILRDEIAYNEDFFIFFDEHIMRLCIDDMKIKKYDLFYGMLGYGSYYLLRARYEPKKGIPYLNKMVELLYQIVLKDEHGTYWEYDDFDKIKNKVNLGMSHGITSIITFLSKVYDINQNLLAKELIETTINWILHYKSPNKEFACFFPYLIDKEHLEEDYKTTRLAWCYGDLGIGYSFIVAGTSIQNNQYMDEGMQILEKCSEKRMENSYTGIADKGFCHGTSGIYYIFNKLILKYKLHQFENTRDYWLNKTIQSINGDITSFYTYAPEVGYEDFREDYGLINGYVGIGLALMSFFNKSEEWDEIFMI